MSTCIQVLLCTTVLSGTPAHNSAFRYSCARVLLAVALGIDPRASSKHTTELHPWPQGSFCYMHRTLQNLEYGLCLGGGPHSDKIKLSLVIEWLARWGHIPFPSPHLHQACLSTHGWDGACVLAFPAHVQPFNMENLIMCCWHQSTCWWLFTVCVCVCGRGS